MAPRKKKDDETEGGATEPVKSSEVQAVISSGKLKKLISSHRSSVRDAAQIAQSLGAEIKDAVKNNHLHARAFKAICSLDKMEPEELRLYMDNFEYYYDVSGLKKRADSVMRMPLEGGGDDDEEGEPRTNVAKFPAATAGSA